MKKLLLFIVLFVAVSAHSAALPTYQQIQKLQAQVTKLQDTVNVITNSLIETYQCGELVVKLNPPDTVFQVPISSADKQSLASSIGVSVQVATNQLQMISYASLSSTTNRVIFTMASDIQEVPVLLVGGIEGWSVVALPSVSDPILIKKGEKKEITIVTRQITGP